MTTCPKCNKLTGDFSAGDNINERDVWMNDLCSNCQTGQIGLMRCISAITSKNPPQLTEEEYTEHRLIANAREAAYNNQSPIDSPATFTIEHLLFFFLIMLSFILMI